MDLSDLFCVQMMLIEVKVTIIFIPRSWSVRTYVLNSLIIVKCNINNKLIWEKVCVPLLMTDH